MDLRQRTNPGISRGIALGTLAGAALLPLAARAQTLQTIKMAGVPEDSVTPALYADQAGIFKRYGLAVDVSPERSGAAISSGVAGGAFQIAKSSLTGLIVAFSKGIPFQLVAPGGIYTSAAPIVALIVKTESPIKTAADLNGKTVAVSALNDIYSLSTREWMEKNGGAPDSIKQLEFPVGAVPDALSADRIDAGGVIEPVLQRALDSGKYRVLAHPFDAIAPRFMYTGWFAMADWAKANAKAVDGFDKAMRDASSYANAHHAQTVDMLAKYTSIEAPVIGKMMRVELGTVMDPKLIQPVINAAAKYKLIAAAFDAKDMIAPSLR